MHLLKEEPCNGFDFDFGLLIATFTSTVAIVVALTMIIVFVGGRKKSTGPNAHFAQIY
jgi:hypothetical protein